MAKRSIKAGTTSQREYVFVNDSASTTGAGKTGIAYNAASIKAYYVRPGASATLITLATQTVTGAFSSGGWVEVDSTNMPGVYRFDVPDAVFAAGAEKAIVMISGASGMAPVVMEYDLTAYDPYDTVRLGLTAIPNVASGSAGALITSGTGTAQLSVSSGLVTLAPVTHTGATIPTVTAVTNRVTANTDQLAGQTVTAANAVTFPSIVSSLTGAGVRTELAIELGRIDVDVSTRLASSSYTTPPTAASNATAVWNSLLSAHTTAGTFGGRIPRSDSSNVEVKITGSAHIAADIHELQPAVIEAQHFATGAIDANALATDAATEIATAVYTGQMTESYRAAGVAPTLAQVAFELIAHMGDSSISGTTKTLKKIDGTTAKTFTLDSATTPTSITEAT
jgi:hypothetical protein